MRGANKRQPLTRQQINADPDFYESVGAYLDGGEIDARYGQLRANGMDHYAAKVAAYEQTLKREYPFNRPGAASSRDDLLASDATARLLAANHPQLLERIEELEAIKTTTSPQAPKQGLQLSDPRLAGGALAALLGAGGLGVLIGSRRPEEDEQVR